jgi:GntR family transcriptional regulator, transcriptional repressor for pyruvate dehydrogenase complex
MQDIASSGANVELFRSVRSGRVSEQIVEQFQEAIFAGKLKPGDRLPPERELVYRFQASRASVREAMRCLAMSGLIAVRPGAGGGACVTAPDFDLVANALRTMLRANQFDGAELYKARLLLEPGIAEMAASLADAEDLALLRASLVEGKERLIRQADTAPASYNFHFLLAKSAKSNLLLMLISSLLDLVHRSDQGEARQARRSPEILRSHETIVGAIERRDPAAARHATEEHLLDLQHHALDKEHQTPRRDRIAS